MRFVPIVVTLSLLVACATPPPSSGPVPSGPAKVSVQFYPIHEEPGSQVVERKVEGTGETVFLGPQPDLTERDIAWAAMQTDRISGRATVLVHFTIEGTDRLAALSQRNIGRRLAIVVDGKIISTPLITGQIGDGRVVIEGFRSPAEAQRVADSLARR